MLIRWEAFCKKTLKISLDFSCVLEIIVILLKPVYGAIIDEKEFFGMWSKEERK